MAAHPRAKQRSRKRRGGAGTAPVAVASARRGQQQQRSAEQARTRRQAHRTLGTAGERPVGIFGPVPVSEIAILAGIIVLLVGLARANSHTQEIGVLICALGVLEVAAREHFSGFRSHTVLLAFIPALIAELLWVFLIGAPDQRLLLLAPVIPIFLLCFYLLRRSFKSARHSRVVGHR